MTTKFEAAAAVLDPLSRCLALNTVATGHQSDQPADMVSESLTPSIADDASSGRPLRTLFAVTSLPVGGAETLLANLVRRFDRGRIEPSIVCLKEPGPLGEELAAEIPVHHGFLRRKYDPGVVMRLARLMRSEQIDAVVTVGAGDKMFWGRIAARFAGVPVVLSALHSTGWPDGVGRLNRLLTPITDGFIAVARSHGEFMRTAERFPAKRIHVIPNGIDCDRFHFDPEARWRLRTEWKIPFDTPVLGVVAALRPEKNLGLLLQAASDVLPIVPDLRIVLVGDGPERPTLESLARDLGLDGATHFLGTRSDIPAVLSALDVFTLTSLNEASPVSILEAMATKRPVVAPDVGSIAESVLEGQTGYLCPVNDRAAFADAYRRMFDRTANRRRMGLEARRHVVENGSLTSMVEGYSSLLERTFAAKTKRKSAS